MKFYAVIETFKLGGKGKPFYFLSQERAKQFAQDYIKHTKTKWAGSAKLSIKEIETFSLEDDWTGLFEHNKG
jgi:hypothetical protein